MSQQTILKGPARHQSAGTQRTIFKIPAADYLFLLAPFWIGALYWALVTWSSVSRPFVFFLYLMVLGETHFAATWLFFLSPTNWDWIKARRFWLIYVPPVLILIYAALGLINIGLAIVIGAVASGYHVTRQSIGVYRLYGGKRRDFSEQMIYVASFGFMAIGFVRFYAAKLFISPLWIDWTTTWVGPMSFLLITAIMIYMAALALRQPGMRRWFAVFTGTLMYAPYCFVAVPQDAIAIGVGMHWCQYLAINFAVYSRRNHRVSSASQNRFLAVLWPVALIVVYGVIMALIGTAAGTKLQQTTLWLLVPLCGQLLHYYIDAFIWRFSDPHIRHEVGTYIWAT